jgi:uncharacterized protein YjiS (DUF1127 family)
VEPIMSTIPFQSIDLADTSIRSHAPSKAAGKAVAAKTPGLFSRFITAFAAARAIQAEREVARYYALRSDDALRDIGLSDAEIAKVRRGSH